MAKEDQKLQTTPERTVILQDRSLKQFKGGFTAIPNRILKNSEITLGARMVYAMLLTYAWQDGFCFPAQERLAKDLGVTDRSVRTFLKELRENELITWKQQGLNRPNIYYILRLPEGDEDGDSGPEKFSVPDRKYISGQDRKPASDYEYSTNNTQHVNVEEKNLLTEDETEEEALIDKLMAQLGDRNRKSRKTYRQIVRSLGPQIVWRLLGNAKEAARDGLIKTTKAKYFMGMAKRVAEGQGVELGFRSTGSKGHTPLLAPEF